MARIALEAKQERKINKKKQNKYGSGTTTTTVDEHGKEITKI